LKTKFTRALAGVAAIAAAATILPLATGAAQAAPLAPGAAQAGSLSVSPASGNGATPFSLNFLTPAAPQFCQGDAVTGGYHVSAIITPLGADIAGFTWNGLGRPSNGPGFTENLFTASGGGRMGNINPDSPTGQVLTLAPANYEVFAPGDVPAGEYKLAVACVKDGLTERYWTRPITITTPGGGAANINWAVGARPAPPTLNTPLTAGDGALSGTFVPGAADPAITGFTVTAAPQPSGTAATLPLAAGATSFAFPTGTLTNGTAYNVTVTATNTVGTSDASNIVSGTPAVGSQPPVASVTATPGSGGSGAVTVGWTAPVGGLTPIGYHITVSPGSFGPFDVSNSTFSQIVTGLAGGTPYTFTVTPTHTAPNFATAASATAVVGGAQVVLQEVTVTRPPGALILTQRCGVFNALPAFSAVDAFPGYPRPLTAATATLDQTGTAPFTVWTDATNSGSIPDPEFGEYPSPAPVTYPTHCGLDLGTAQYVSGGTLAGQYYTADGRLNEVTVVDTRDNDSGWTIKGSMDPFVGTTSASNTFSGNYLGWTPVMTDDSDPSGLPVYDQLVTAGSEVLPGSGVASGTGLGSVGGQTLASAPALSGLGIATLDARVMLLIPASANADTYTGTLTITAIETP
jgi:hypothetical protein